MWTWVFFRGSQGQILLRQLPFHAGENQIVHRKKGRVTVSQEQNEDDDILLKLTMPGKSLRMNPKDAPQMPEQRHLQQPIPSSPSPAQAPQPVSPVQSPSHIVARQQAEYQPQRETNTIVPPANTPPKTEEAQEDILRKLTMKSKEYVSASPTSSQAKEIRPPPGMYYQTAEESRINKPYVSSDHEVERVRKLTQNIYGSDMVQKRTQKK